MGSDPIRAVFDQWTEGVDRFRRRIVLFEKVRDIPYAYPTSRDPAEVLHANRGSCSGKHYLLGALYRELGLPTRHMICTHRFNESPIAFPDDMQDALRRNEIVDLHDYLQIEVDGRWLEVDATWQADLRAFGFPVNEDWDGKTPMSLSVVPDELTLVESDPEKQKEAMLAKLTPRQRTLRKQFLDALNGWVQDLTAELQRDGEG